ncbi:MAG: glycerol kinase GlpK, partial [Thermomicrobiales bacterium]
MATKDSLILAIDQGTTSSRAVLFDSTQAPVFSAQRDITLLYPHPGWVQQNADELWRITHDVANQAVEAATRNILGIGITNQRETTILWDRAIGKPCANAINWQSRETSPIVESIVARGMADTYQAITGLVPDAYFSATKIAMMFERDPQLRERAAAGDIAFGTVDSWLIWKLSGGRLHVTDYANASRTMLYDIRKLEWSSALLSDLDIPAAILPEVVTNSGLIGETDADVLGMTLPIAGTAGDQQSALFGQRCFLPGEAKNTYGTGSFLLMQTGTEAMASTHRMLTTIAWGIDGVVEYALEGAIFVTGAAVQWLRDGLGIIRNAAEIEPLAASVRSTEGVSFVPALTGLGAPHWDAHARGTIAGITRGTTKAHIARATLEAIAFQSRDSLQAMQSDSGIELAELRVDGGASANDLLMQIQADILGVPVVRPANIETTVAGAAALAGLGLGVWSNREDLVRDDGSDRRFEPAIDNDERESRYAEWKTVVS